MRARAASLRKFLLFRLRGAEGDSTLPLVQRRSKPSGAFLAQQPLLLSDLSLSFFLSCVCVCVLRYYYLRVAGLAEYTVCT